MLRQHTVRFLAEHLVSFPKRNEVPDFPTFSLLLRITGKYELSCIRSQLLEIIRGVYPDNFEGLTLLKPLGERIFNGPTSHPNEVLNLFVQQKLISALPMAYYMAARRGLDSLMSRDVHRNATLLPGALQCATRALMTLREVERDEMHRLIFRPKDSCPCSASKCPLHTPTSSAALTAYQKVFDRAVSASQLGTKVLQVLEFYGTHLSDLQDPGPSICSSCVGKWESGHAELRRKTWATLPDIFGLND